MAILFVVTIEGYLVFIARSAGRYRVVTFLIVVTDYLTRAI